MQTHVYRKINIFLTVVLQPVNQSRILEIMMKYNILFKFVEEVFFYPWIRILNSFVNRTSVRMHGRVIRKEKGRERDSQREREKERRR